LWKRIDGKRERPRRLDKDDRARLVHLDLPRDLDASHASTSSRLYRTSRPTLTKGGPSARARHLAAVTGDIPSVSQSSFSSMNFGLVRSTNAVCPMSFGGSHLSSQRGSVRAGRQPRRADRPTGTRTSAIVVGSDVSCSTRM
jgi:hypothetical protein